ncbi:putative acetate--CoA ligase [Helianthus debilis subsp. tardiflorus]
MYGKVTVVTEFVIGFSIWRCIRDRLNTLPDFGRRWLMVSTGRRNGGQEVNSENLDITKGNIKIEWFKGGITNNCYNCFDRNIESGNGEKITIHWEGNDHGVDDSLTYNQLLDRVCKVSCKLLERKWSKKGDSVIIYLPMLMELPISMLACARIGAIHSVVFVGFSAESLEQRITDCKPKILITCNAVKRGTKVINLKDIVDSALSESSQNGVHVGLCLTYANEPARKKEDTKWQKERDVWWQDVVPKCSTKCDVEWVDAQNPLFLLYTSGSTGKPKVYMYRIPQLIFIYLYFMMTKWVSQARWVMSQDRFGLKRAKSG